MTVAENKKEIDTLKKRIDDLEYLISNGLVSMIGELSLLHYTHEKRKIKRPEDFLKLPKKREDPRVSSGSKVIETIEEINNDKTLHAQDGGIELMREKLYPEINIWLEKIGTHANWKDDDLRNGAKFGN